jgi:hypothetical protein
MTLWSLITQPASAFREFVAPRYGLNSTYTRGPGQLYAHLAAIVAYLRSEVEAFIDEHFARATA